MEISIQGLDAVNAALRNLTKVAPQAARRAMSRCGLIAVRESKANAPAITMFQVAQNLENAGTDLTSQTTTQTPTVDVKPDIDVEVPVTKTAAGGAAADCVGAAVKSACSGGECSD